VTADNSDESVRKQSANVSSVKPKTVDRSCYVFKKCIWVSIIKHSENHSMNMIHFVGFLCLTYDSVDVDADLK